MKRGFTLIETILYLALLALIMGGALASAFGIIASSARNQSKAIVQQEGEFLLGKIDWVLTGVQTITLPSLAPGDTLSVVKYDVSVGNPVIIAVSGGAMTIKRGSNPSQVLNNLNVQVLCPATNCFSHTAPSSDGINPESVTATFTVHATTTDGMSYSQDFSTAKFLRK